jgi:hypothetical protein
MNREDIIRMAREAGCIESAIPDWVIRTCALVASAEREACARVCEGIAIEARTLWKARYEPHDDGRSDGAFECVEAIRKGGL